MDTALAVAVTDILREHLRLPVRDMSRATSAGQWPNCAITNDLSARAKAPRATGRDAAKTPKRLLA